MKCTLNYYKLPINTTLWLLTSLSKTDSCVHSDFNVKACMLQYIDLYIVYEVIPKITRNHYYLYVMPHVGNLCSRDRLRNLEWEVCYEILKTRVSVLIFLCMLFPKYFVFKNQKHIYFFHFWLFFVKLIDLMLKIKETSIFYFLTKVLLISFLDY